MDVQSEHQSFTSFRSRGIPEQCQRYRRYSLGRRGYADNPGGVFAGPASHKGSFYEDEEGWFEAMLGPLDRQI